MGYDAAFQNYTTAVQTYWQNVTKRMNAIRNKLDANNYHADDLATDVAGSWVETIDAWLGVMPPFMAPVVPTGFIQMPANNPDTSKTPVTLSESLSPANVALVRASDLGQLGGANSIPSADVAYDIKADTVDLYLRQAGTNPPQALNAFTAGIYQGVLYVAGGHILANIVLVAY